MDTLVLSRTWEVDRVVDWQEAMSLLVSGRVEIVEEYDDRFVHSITVTFNMPSVVRFINGLRFRKSKVKFSRQNVYARDKGRCQYCSKKMPRHKSTFDHVIPRCKGGKTTWENIVISCLKCNQKKGGRTPNEARMRPLAVPVRPKYLSDVNKITLTRDKDVPPSWKNYVRDARYWNVELEQD